MTRVRPTVFGIVVSALLVGTAIVRPPMADTSVTGMVWAGLAGAIVLGLIWPIITVRTLGVRVVAAPTDLVVGQLSSLELELSGRASGLSIGATGSETAVVDVVAPGRVRVPVSIAKRGAYTRVRIDVGSDAPFGIVYASRRREVELPRRMLVGPVVIDQTSDPKEIAGALQDPVPSGQGHSGESVRSVRPYVSGDPAHLVHWPSTARIGSLVVKEMEPPATRAIAVVVELTGAVADEVVAGRAAGLAESALLQGARVVLCTAEASGPVADEVADVLGVQRRLALAVPGRPAPVPEGWPAITPSPNPVAPNPVGPSPVAPDPVARGEGES